MDGSTVMMFMGFFNAATVTALAAFAVFGIVAPYFKKKLRGNVLLSASCAAVLAALALEATLYNSMHYISFFSDPQTGILKASESDPNAVLTTDGTRAELIENGVRFKNLNRKITSIFADVDFNGGETAEMLVEWVDDGVAQQYADRLYRDYPRKNYVPLRSRGEVSELAITFNVAVGTDILPNIVINKPIPFHFSGLRLAFVSMLLFAAFSLASKKLRAKIAAFWAFLTMDNGSLRESEDKQSALFGDNFSKGALYLFVLISCGLFLAFVWGLALEPHGKQRYIFVAGAECILNDFIFVLHDIAGRDPYFVKTYLPSCYFPLSYLILYPFSQLDNFAAMAPHETLSSKIGLLSAMSFTCFSVLLLFAALSQMVKKYSVPLIILISLALSYVFIFTVERGNFIIIAAACVYFFICNYDSQDRRKRILAIISLALAVTLKIYPIVFGILYLTKKQYREMFLCAVVTLPLVFVPYLFFKGDFANIPQHIRVLQTGFSYFTQSTSVYARFSFSNVLYVVLSMFETPEKTILSLLSVTKVATIIACIVALIFACVEENKWLKISLITMALLFMPACSVLYCGLYMFPMIILFFSTTRERTKLFNIFIFICFIVFLNPFQLAVMQGKHPWHVSANYLIMNACLLLLYLALLISSGKRIATRYIRSVQRKKSCAAVAADQTKTAEPA